MNDFTSKPTDSNNEFIPLPKHILLPTSLGSDACPWLDEYTEYSTKWSPRSYEGYHEATGLFVLSTVASRRVSYEFSRTRFTNLYFALVGRSSITYKSTAARIGKDVLIAAGLDWMLLPDTTTPQKMINLMSNSVPDNYQSLPLDQKTRIQEKLKFAGQKGWYYEEFGQMFIDMMKSNGPMVDFRGHLRRLDDTPDRFENATIARDLETIDYPYLSVLGITTPDDLLPYAKKGSHLWGDGFLARFFLVAPDPNYFSNEQFPRGQGVIRPH